MMAKHSRQEPKQTPADAELSCAPVLQLMLCNNTLVQINMLRAAWPNEGTAKSLSPHMCFSQIFVLHYIATQMHGKQLSMEITL